MKRFCVILFFMIGYLAVMAQDRRADTIVAIVNDEIITYGEVVQKVKEGLYGIENSNLSRHQKDIQKNRLMKMELRRMVDEKLTMQEAKRYNIKISEESIKQQLERELKEKGKTLDSGEVDLMDLMRSRLTVQELLHKKAGYSKDDKRRAAIDTFVSPMEIRYVYGKNIHEFTKQSKIKTRIITLLYDKHGGKEKTLQKAKAIVTELREGADFAELARLHSNDGYAREGGTWPRIEKEGEAVWGFFGRNEALYEQVEDIAFDLKEGEISDPVPVDRQSFCQIVKVEAIQAGETVPFVNVQETISQKIRYEKIIAALNLMQNHLRERAFIWPPDLFKEN